MTHFCNEICKRHRATRPVDGKRYSMGQKCCKTCSVFMKYDGIYCPCCGYRLRTMPRHTENRKEVRMIRVNKKIN